MINSKKPLVGHNCMYDFMFVFHQFFGELPETYAEFISQWSKLFPLCYDTKVLAWELKREKTTLDQLFK